jgi:ABC-type antimicrobial peptide transport system permease subunit
MMADVEERTYEFAMLRVLGLPVAKLTSLLGVQTLSFSLPGYAVGMGIMYMLTFFI